MMHQFRPFLTTLGAIQGLDPTVDAGEDLGKAPFQARAVRLSGKGPHRSLPLVQVTAAFQQTPEKLGVAGGHLESGLPLVRRRRPAALQPVVQLAVPPPAVTLAQSQ